MALADDGADPIGDLLVTHDILKVVVEPPVVLSDGEIEVDADPLVGLPFVPVHTDGTRQHQIADEDVAQRPAGVGNGQGMDNV